MSECAGAAYSRLENMDRPESRISIAYRAEGGTFDRSESRLSRRSLGPPRPPPPRSPRPESPRVETTDLSRLGSLGKNVDIHCIIYSMAKQYSIQWIEYIQQSYYEKVLLVAQPESSKRRLYKRSNTSKIEMLSDREMVRETSKRASMIEEETRKVSHYQFID